MRNKKQWGFLLLFSMGTAMLTLLLILEFYTMPKARALRSSESVAALQEAINQYWKEKGDLPPQEPRALLRALQGQGENSQGAQDSYLSGQGVLQEGGQAVDVWGQPLLVEFKDGNVRVFSAGKDKKPRTEDDIDGSLWLEFLVKASS